MHVFHVAQEVSIITLYIYTVVTCNQQAPCANVASRSQDTFYTTHKIVTPVKRLLRQRNIQRTNVLKALDTIEQQY